MKNYFSVLALIFSCQAFSSVYIEGDILYPALNLLERTKENRLDIRAGYQVQNWDFSLRYQNVRGLSYSGGVSGSMISNNSISDAEDTFVSLRVGRMINSFTIGAGVGSYNRDFETSFGPGDNKIYGKNVVGFEAFANYNWSLGMVFIRPEINYITADLPHKASRASGGDSYDISYEKPGLNFLLLVGLQF